MIQQLTSNKNFIRLFWNTFKGRKDVVPKHWSLKDYKTGKLISGYSPICSNRKTSACLKTKDNKATCKTCEQKIYTPLSDDLLNDHFNGKRILGVYPLLKDNTCWWIAADFDNHKGTRDPLKDIKAYSEACVCQDIPLYIIRSKSGNGYHAYIFFDQPVQAWKARVVAFSLLGEAQVISENDKLQSFDRLFPNQDELKTNDGLGNLIGLPFQNKASVNGHTLFLDPESDFLTPDKNQMEILNSIKRVSEEQLDDLISEWNLKRVETAKSTVNYVDNKNEQFQKLLECNFIRRMYENQDEQTEPLWFSMISNVSRISPGGPELCHLCSKDYKGYSRSETDQKIINVLNGSKPHTCEHIKSNGFCCEKNCGVKSPIGLIYKKTMNCDNAKTSDIADVKESIDKIIELSKTNPDNLLSEITKDNEYQYALAITLNKDIALWESLKIKLRKNNVKQKDIATIWKVARQNQKKLKNICLIGTDDQKKLVKVKEVLNGAPIGDGIVVPVGWELSYEKGLERVIFKKDGLGNIFSENIPVSSAPILITARLINKLTGTEVIRISWFRDGKWKNHMIERKVIAKANDITSLADVGLTVTSNTAKNLVEYFDKFESTNKETLPRAQMSQHMGWQDGKSFLLGKTLYREGEVEENGIDIDEIPPENWKQDWIAFRPDDEGNQQIAGGFKAKGSYKKWIEAINQLFDYPKVISAVYFSLLPPFLEILDAPNFTVDWCNPTSSGKTITLRIAGSCWGNPDERKNASVVHTWDTTKVAAGRMAIMLNGLPFIMNDTKLASNSVNKFNAGTLVSYIIYLIESGKDKARGSLQGIRNRGTWRTIMLSSGEQPAISFSKDGGAVPRVITLWAKPFGQTNQEMGRFVKNLNLTIKNNYGHAGQRIINFIFKHQDKWNLWKNSYLQNQKIFGEKAEGNQIADRISEYFALLQTVIPIIHEALPELMNDPPVDAIINDLWSTALSEAKEADRSAEALGIVYNWAVKNQQKFWGRHRTNQDGEIIEPLGGWVGAWKADNWKCVSIETQQAMNILEKENFDADAILRDWKDRGWLIVGKNGRGRGKLHRINSEFVNCYDISKDAINEINGFKPKDHSEKYLLEFISRLKEQLSKMMQENKHEAKTFINDLESKLNLFLQIPDKSDPFSETDDSLNILNQLTDPFKN